MRIAFDAKRAFLNDTGLGNYSRILLNSLFEYYPDHEYFLATPKVSELYEPVVKDNIHVIEPAGVGKYLKPVWRSSLIKQELKRLHVDLYHGLSHEIPVGISYTRIRSIVTIHDLIFERYPQQYNATDVLIYRSKFKHACRNADKIIAVSRQTMQDLVDIYEVPENKIRVCYPSYGDEFMREVSDAEKQQVRSIYQLPQEYYLYVGAIIERKNLLLICKAMNELKGKLEIPLVVVGRGKSYLEEVKAYLTEHGLTNNVIFLSETAYVAQAQLPVLYQCAMALIYPSIFEGFGLPILEGLVSRVPVITSQISCMPETGGDAAYYIDPYDEESLAIAMQKVAEDKALREAMISKGIEHAANFTQHICAANVMKVYEEVMKKGKRI